MRRVKEYLKEMPNSVRILAFFALVFLLVVLFYPNFEKIKPVIPYLIIVVVAILAIIVFPVAFEFIIAAAIIASIVCVVKKIYKSSERIDQPSDQVMN